MSPPQVICGGLYSHQGGTASVNSSWAAERKGEGLVPALLEKAEYVTIKKIGFIVRLPRFKS